MHLESKGNMFPNSWIKFSSECACMGTLLGILSSRWIVRHFVQKYLSYDYGMGDGDLWKVLKSIIGVVE